MADSSEEKPPDNNMERPKAQPVLEPQRTGGEAWYKKILNRIQGNRNEAPLQNDDSMATALGTKQNSMQSETQKSKLMMSAVAGLVLRAHFDKPNGEIASRHLRNKLQSTQSNSR